ncbi:MAG: hypothetical protein DCO81_02185 [Candidatus Aquiluna sp. XM-24bin5]|nr:MAG: hypothetical protein DCO81_02185 [Candidatus Aquiluna sp. XM-24bin5]
MELRFVNRESDFLVFETSDGEKLRALIDDQLREAIRNTQQLGSSGISPKDVQNRIRQGESVEQVATDLGVPETTIEPFAAPIIDELNYILEAALATEVNDGSNMLPFSQLIGEESPGATFAIRREDDKWIVTVSGSKQMQWHFDNKSRHLEPMDTNASTVAKVHANRDIVTSTIAVVEEASEPEAEASVHDLVEELRSRRNKEPIKPATAKGRASLPSWDEIVLGTSNSEPEAQ